VKMKTNRSNERIAWSVALTMLAMAGLLCGCGTTTQARKARPAGFLGDYSQLKPGAEGQALLVYVNAKADFKKYDKILMDPIRAYAGKDSKIAKVSKEDLQALLNYFDATVREQLKSDYTFVAEPGPGVMRLQIALTEASDSSVVLDCLSSVTPPGIALSGLKQLATGAPTSTGSVGAECQAVDSMSKVRLFAAVDARVGQKYTGKFDKFNEWRAAQGAFDYWAGRLKARLAEVRVR
jgi:hypothetical protein